VQPLIVSQHFWRENLRVKDLAMEMARRGHSGTVLTDLLGVSTSEYARRDFDRQRLLTQLEAWMREPPRNLQASQT